MRNSLKNIFNLEIVRVKNSSNITAKILRELLSS